MEIFNWTETTVDRVILFLKKEDTSYKYVVYILCIYGKTYKDVFCLNLDFNLIYFLTKIEKRFKFRE